MKIKAMLLISAAAAGTATAVLSAVSYLNSSSILADANHIIEDQLLTAYGQEVEHILVYDETARLLLNADRDAYQTLEAELKCLHETDADRLEEYRGDAEANTGQVYDRVTKAFALLEGRVEQETKQKFLDAHASWKEQTEAVFDACQSGDCESVARPDLVAERVAAFNEMRDLIDLVSERIEEGANESIANVEAQTEIAREEVAAMASASSQRLTVLLAVGAVSVLGVLGILVPLSLLVSRRMSAMAKAMESVATGKADLTLRVNDPGKDEIATLGRWFDKLIERFENVVIDVQDASGAVTDGTRSIASRAEEVNSQISVQTNGIRQTSAAVTELSSSVDEVAGRCQEVANTASRSRELTSTGGHVVRETVESMGKIEETFTTSGKSIEVLGESMDRIGSFIDVINDIAEQTNLLALNAAIEAARAGQHGRGFAVVADEVRKLADRTTQATEEIASSIHSIQGETNTAVEQMRDGTERVRMGAEQAGQAGTSLSEIEEAILQVANMVESIAATTIEQASATGEINRESEEIAHTSDTISRSMTEAVNDISRVRAASERLSAVVSEFKTSRSAA